MSGIYGISQTDSGSGCSTILVIGAVGLGILGYLSYNSDKKTYQETKEKTSPRTEQVIPKYETIRKLEFRCKDLDGDGKLDTTVNIGNKSYLLKEIDGKPLLFPYKIKPSEIIIEK